VAAVNGDEMVYAASLPKIAILLGAFVEIDQGEMTLDQNTRDSLTRMIRVSSNEDATRMLNRVGKNRLLDILQSRKFHLYDPQVNGGLWVGKEYGNSAAYQRDPLHNLSHGATAMQTARFYYLLETGQLVGPRLTREMKAMLGNPGIKHKFVKGLADYPAARIFRKSGSWRQWHADSAIVEAEGHKYIIVALAEDPNGGSWLSRLIQPIHEFMVPTRLASAGH
jgi:beta-lactamase class A